MRVTNIGPVDDREDITVGGIERAADAVVGVAPKDGRVVGEFVLIGVVMLRDDRDEIAMQRIKIHGPASGVETDEEPPVGGRLARSVRDLSRIEDVVPRTDLKWRVTAVAQPASAGDGNDIRSRNIGAAAL